MFTQQSYQYYDVVVTKDKKRHKKQFRISSGANNDEKDQIHKKAKDYQIELSNQLGLTVQQKPEIIDWLNTPEDHNMVYSGSVFSTSHQGHHRLTWTDADGLTQTKEFFETDFDEAKQYLDQVRQQFGNGSMCFRNPYTEVCAVVQNDGDRYTKKFRVKEDENLESIMEKANAWKRYTSNKFGLTYCKEHPPSKTVNSWKRYTSNSKDPPLSNIAHVTNETKQHIAGFFDGDGGIAASGKGMLIHFAQSGNSGIPPILQHIQLIYGGTINKKEANHENQKPKYALRIHENFKLWDIVRDIQPYCIVKQHQVNLCLEWLSKRWKHEEFDKKDLFKRLQSMNCRSFYETITYVDPIRLSDAYISGLFDAEGCVCLDKKMSLHVELSQLSCPAILFAIQKHMNAGVIPSDRSRITFNSSKGKEFVQRILPYSIRKKDELLAAQPYIQAIKDRLRGEKRKQMDETTYKTLKKLKQV